jgi:hypothetical protein
MGQVVSGRPKRFDPKPRLVASAVHDGLGKISSKFRFRRHSALYRLLHAHTSSEVGTPVAGVPSGLRLTPANAIKNFLMTTYSNKNPLIEKQEEGNCKRREMKDTAVRFLAL